MANLCMSEFQCADCGIFEELVERPVPDEHPCPVCGTDASWVMSAPHGKVKIAEVQRGKSDERPPWALDTRDLADGMPMHEWRAKQDKLDRDRRIKKNREALK